jgi:hypothetical protein
MGKLYRVIGSLICAITLIGILTGLASDRPIITEPRVFTSSLTLPVTDISPEAFYLTSVMLTFPSPVAANTFSITWIKNGIRYPLLSVTASNFTSLTWYVPGRIWINAGTMVFSNSVATSARVYISREY